jgi:ribosome-associated protein
LKTSVPDSLALASEAANLAEDRKGQDIVVLRTAAVTTIADYFVICSCESRTQVRAVGDTIRQAFKDQYNLLPMGEERDTGDVWHLLDYGDIIVHVMHSVTRDHYKLDSFWQHAEAVPHAQWYSPIERQVS